MYQFLMKVHTHLPYDWKFPCYVHSQERKNICPQKDLIVNIYKQLYSQLEKEMATHSSILAWKIPWTEDPGRPQCPWGHREWDMTE